MIELSGHFLNASTSEIVKKRTSDRSIYRIEREYKTNKVQKKQNKICNSVLAKIKF